MCKLYLMNLSHMTRDEELSRLCRAFGAVRSAHVLNHLKTGISSVSGLVEMDSPEGARQALANLHDSEYHGRRLIVCPATADQAASFDRMRGPLNLAADILPHTGAAGASMGPQKGGFGDRGGDRPRGSRLFIFADTDRSTRSK